MSLTVALGRQNMYVCMYVWRGRQNIDLFRIMNYETASQSNHRIPIPCPFLYAMARLTHLRGVTGFENCLLLLLRMLIHLAQFLILVGILQPSSVKTRLNGGLGQKRKIGAALKLN